MEYDRYVGRNGCVCSVDKITLRNIIDPLQPRTFIKFLVEMDLPFFEEEWIRMIEGVLNQNAPTSFVIGKYIAKMNLPAFRQFTFEDSIFDNTVTKYKVKIVPQRGENIDGI